MMLRHMLPYAALNDRVNVAIPDAVSLPEPPRRHPTSGRSANSEHITLGQLRLWMRLAARNAVRMKPAAAAIAARASLRWHMVTYGLTSLADHVRRIVGISPKKQVGRVDASGIVAPMKNAQWPGGCMIGKLPCDAVRLSGSPEIIDTAITIGEQIAGPRPASGWPGAPVNLAPKPLFWCASHVLTSYQVGATLPGRSNAAGSTVRSTIVREMGAQMSIRNVQAQAIALPVGATVTVLDATWTPTPTQLGGAQADVVP